MLVAFVSTMAFLVLPGSAQALTVASQTAPSCAEVNSRTNWGPTQLRLTKFDPSVGTLTAVTLDRSVSMESTYSVTSADNKPENIDFEVNGSVTLSVPAMTTMSAALSQHRTFIFSGNGVYTGTLGPESATDRVSIADLAAWTGSGTVDSSAQASAMKVDQSSGNADVSIRTTARAKVCVTYSYTNEVLVCIGDYVWYDMDEDGIQDASETGVAGRGIVVRDGAGVVLGSASTDANGRWKMCGLEPSTACVASVDLPDGWNLTAATQGGDRTVDSDGLASGSDAAISCITPSKGEDLTFDTGIHRSPEPAQADAPAPASLRASKIANRKAIGSGGLVKFTVRVTNRGGTAVRGLKVCDTPPTQLAFTSKPRGAAFRNGQLCWKVTSLAPGKTASFGYTMRAAHVAARSCVTNRATIAATIGGTASAKRAICINATKLGELPLAG